MSQLLETIQCKDGVLQNMKYHQRRFSESQRQVFGCKVSPNLNDEIRVPDDCKSGLFRVRVVYSDTIELVEFIPATKRRFNTLQMVKSDFISYSVKSLDRQELNSLSEKRDGADEILIVKNGNITDTSISNVVFLKEGKWFTPSTYLLNGTKRQLLIESGKIAVCDINMENIHEFSYCMLINALLDFDESRVLSVSDIRPPK